MATLEAAAARERFAAARVARLATLTVDGAPHLVPFVFVVDGDTVYSTVDDKPKRTTALARLAHIDADPRVCLLADHYAEDWSQLWWARADGIARVLLPGDESEVQRAAALLAARYPQQQRIGAVVAVAVTRWSGWSAAAAAS